MNFSKDKWNPNNWSDRNFQSCCWSNKNILLLSLQIVFRNLKETWQFSCYCYFSSCEFFTPLLTGGFSLESEWQQVTSDLQDSSLLADFNCTVILVSILPLILNSFSLLSKSCLGSSIIIIVESSLFQYTMDSSNKDITVGCNPLSEFSHKSYTGIIVLLVFCNI